CYMYTRVLVLLVAYTTIFFVFFFQAEDGIRDDLVTGVQTCALPIWRARAPGGARRGDGRAREPRGRDPARRPRRARPRSRAPLDRGRRARGDHRDRVRARLGDGAPDEHACPPRGARAMRPHAPVADHPWCEPASRIPGR